MRADKFETLKHRDKSLPGFNIFIPLVLILMLVAFVDSGQSFIIYFKGRHTIFNFLKILIEKNIYCLYFLLPVVIIRRSSEKIALDKSDFLKWTSFHFTVMVMLLFTHQALNFGLNYFLWQGKSKLSYYDLLFNNPAAWLDILVYILFVVGLSILESKRKNDEKEIQLSKLEVQFLKTKLNELRNKIHPRFLFNTIGIISGLIKKGRNKEANYVLGQLSDFLRITVYGGDKEEIKFEEELDFVERYLEIEKMRFNNEFRLEKKIDQKLLSAVIPNFVIQPVIEKMINRINPSSSENYVISISCSDYDEILRITIEDNFPANFEYFDIEDDETGFLKITEERLKRIYGGQYKLTINKAAASGIKFNILLPLIFSKETWDSNLLPESTI